MQLEIGISTRRYLPASGTAGLARSFVKGNSRVPWPPPMITASTLLLFTDWRPVCDIRVPFLLDANDFIPCFPERPQAATQLRYPLAAHLDRSTAGVRLRGRSASRPTLCARPAPFRYGDPG